MHVAFLPVYQPSPEEQQDAILYANNVRKLMAETLGVRPTEHGFEDVLLQCEVRIWHGMIDERECTRCTTC